MQGREPAQVLSRLFGLLQKVGRSLMLPVSVLPVAGIFLGVGSAKLSWVNPLLATVMATSGGAIFANLPLLFALGVALGLAEYEGVAAVAASLGYFVMLSTLGVVGAARGLKLTSVSGVPTLETGVFGGIMLGLLAGFVYQRYHRLELPAYLGFFAGKRSVPMITGGAALLLGVVLGWVWPPVQRAIEILADEVATKNPTLSVAVWAVVNRALIPFGLHHIWNNPFFFQIGSYHDPVSGNIIHGDLYRFFAHDPSAGILGGGYLFAVWGLPAAALAMWHCAAPDKRKEVGGIMLSGALTSVLTGITEPLEFSFLFVAPLLYGVHAVLAGVACWLMLSLGGHIGFTFSFGLIDYVLLYPLHTKPWLMLVLGPPFALLYYTVFRSVIQIFDLKTLGRESRTSPLLLAVGGRANLLESQFCAHTRWRLRLKDSQLLQESRLLELGVIAVQHCPDEVVHLIVPANFPRPDWHSAGH